jgi:hypothetical protein
VGERGPAASLGLVERVVGGLEQACDVGAVRGRGSGSDRDARCLWSDFACERAPDFADDARRRGFGLLLVVDPKRKFIPTEPAGQAVMADDPGDLRQHEIACGVTVSVVDVLEPVDVADEQHPRLPLRQSAPDLFEERAPALDGGELIDLGQPIERAHPFSERGCLGNVSLGPGDLRELVERGTGRSSRSSATCRTSQSGSSPRTTDTTEFATWTQAASSDGDSWPERPP